MNVSPVLTKDYENDNVFLFQKNKPNQTQTNSKRVGWGLACGELACTELACPERSRGSRSVEPTCGELVEPYPTNSSEKSLQFHDGFDNL